MPAAKINLSQMVDLAVGTPEVGAVNANVLHTLLHAMLRQLNIVDVQADLNDIDRGLLSASKARELSVLSDVDSGQGDDAVDAHTSHSESSSSIPTPSPGKRTPYQFLKVKGAKLQEKLRRIRSVPSNNLPFEKSSTKNEKKTIGDMELNMQLMNQVDTNDNEKGIAKLNIDDLMNKRLNAMEKSMLNIDDLMKRSIAMEKIMNEMNERFNTLPSHDDFAKFVPRTELEDTLQGIRQDCGNLQQPTERVVIEMSSQTDPVPSRPTSSRSVTHGKMLGEVVKSHGKMLDNIVESHEALTICVEDLEAEMGKKLDQGLLDGLNVSSEILEQLHGLKEQVDALAAAREQISEPLELLDSPPSTRAVTSNDDLKEIQATDITSLEMKVSMLQNQIYQIQDSINLDDSTRWEISRGTQYEEEFSLLFTENEPDKTRNLAYVVNDQLHDIRDDLRTLDKKLKKKATVQAESEPVEILLERTNAADFKDTDLDDLLKSQDANREEIKRVFACCKELRQSKADKTEMHQKADKMAFVAVNSLVERKTNDILNKLAVNEDNWNEQCQIFSDNINEKLDREELEPLKEALNKLKKENQAPVEWVDDDAAVIMSDTSKSTSITERQKGNMAESDQNALKVHIESDDEAVQKQRNASNDYVNADNNTTNRSCGRQHTTTNPRKRLSKRPHLSNIIFKEDVETNVYPLYKEELDVQGADGNIYKGRMGRVEAKLPPITQVTQEASSMQRKDKSPQQIRCKVMRMAKPSSDKMLHAPRPPPPKNGSRPH